MNERERFLACMEYQSVDRHPFWDWWAWPETEQRWRAEGFDPQLCQPARLADRRHWIAQLWQPNPPFENQTLQEDAQTRIFINHEGIVMKELKNHPASSMPEFLKFPVETRQDFRTFWQQHMQWNLDARAGAAGHTFDSWLRQLRQDPIPLVVISDRWGGFFGPLRNMVGVERLCLLFHDDPAFVEEMMEAVADFTIALLGRILDTVPIDVFGLWEDMAYNHAPLIGPEMVRKYMLPRYRRVLDFARSRGVKYLALDSDGKIDALIPVWLDAGLNTLYPFEVQCGMDVLAIRRTYGRDLRIWGGVDKRALKHGPAAIDAEINRVRPLIEQGGYIAHTDHSCPPDISFANYCYYLARMAAVCRGRA